ncbi:MAG: hypothetical protein IT292_06710 [Deltaproteobacteria bacterium]|nr:hypothetical protein [Deltaproteobacteria bacterium]
MNFPTWMLPEEIKLLESYLRPEDVMLEYGCGGSTLRFSQLVKKYYSVEHDQEWFAKVSSEIVATSNIVLHHVSVLPEVGKEFDDYISFPKQLKIHFNKVLIDGRARSHCAKFIKQYLADDALIFIHDFFPRSSYWWVLEKDYQLIDSSVTPALNYLVKSKQPVDALTLAVLKPRFT